MRIVFESEKEAQDFLFDVVTGAICPSDIQLSDRNSGDCDCDGYYGAECERCWINELTEKGYLLRPAKLNVEVEQ